jgi:hypothetical protein
VFLDKELSSLFVFGGIYGSGEKRSIQGIKAILKFCVEQEVRLINRSTFLLVAYLLLALSPTKLFAKLLEVRSF